MSKPLYPVHEVEQVRLELPKIACIPVRPFLIITSALAFGMGFWLLVTYLSRSPEVNMTHVQLVFGITFHFLVIIGSVNYYDMMLHICEVICVISMVLCALASLLILCTLDLKVIILMQVWIGIALGVNWVEYTCLCRLRKYIAERRGIDQSFA